MEPRDPRALRPSSRAVACCIALLMTGPVVASDNSNSSLEVIALLEQAHSKPINHTLPPINIRTKPPSLQMLQAQLAADQAVLLNETQALTQALLQLNFWL